MPKNYSIFSEDDNLKILSCMGRAPDVNSINDFSKVFHEEIEIKLFYEGNSTLIIDKENVAAAVGDVVFINPYEFHSTIDAGGECGKYHLIMIGLDFFKGESRDMPDLRHLFIGERTKINTLIRGDERVSRIVYDISEELNQKKFMYEFAVRGLVLELFSILMREYKSDEKLDCTLDKNIRYYEAVYPAISKIRREYTKKLSIDELAAVCNVSKYHFCRIFKLATSLTAIQYQNEYRLRIADIFLENTNKGISEIAELCGFESIYYFSRCYKNTYGISPNKKRAILCK